MKNDFYIIGARTPQDFDGFPMAEPRPKDWRDKTWVWVANRAKTCGARVQGHAFAKRIVDGLNNAQATKRKQ
jgi:hypothetical protein